MSSAWSQLDQLLTCAICLDRYRNPRLLPCQHTFCQEPCLEGLVDYARRQIKCPECRAEHRIPYQGVQSFAVNVTLMRFLELHRDITGEEPEPPPSSMERCGVCTEKAYLERCHHCDKKICQECREAHVDILRREINRINGQVKRGLHRLSDALTQTQKNAQKLQQNCNQVREEIEDLVKRYTKDIRDSEEKMKQDLDVYIQKEMKSITKLKDDLEVEVSNLSSNCELVEKHVNNNNEAWTDAELVEYKEIFLKTLEFIRNFDVDTSDFARKIKFSPKTDPDALHRTLSDFGEIKINVPPTAIQNSGQATSNALMRSQSDHRLAAQFQRRQQESKSLLDVPQRFAGHTSDSERDNKDTPGFGRNRRGEFGNEYRRFGDRSNPDHGDPVSSAPRSRFLRDDFSRWRDNDQEPGGYRSRFARDDDSTDTDFHHHHGSTRTVRFEEPQPVVQQTAPPPREKIFETEDATKGPLSGLIRLMDSAYILERLHQNETRLNKEDRKNSETPPATAPSVPTPPIASYTPQPPPRRQTSRQASEDEIEKQKKQNQQQQQPGGMSSPPPPSSPQQEPPQQRPALRRPTKDDEVSRRPSRQDTQSPDHEAVSSRHHEETQASSRPSWRRSATLDSTAAAATTTAAADDNASETMAQPQSPQPRSVRPLGKGVSLERTEEESQQQQRAPIKAQKKKEDERPTQSSFYCRVLGSGAQSSSKEEADDEEEESEEEEEEDEEEESNSDVSNSSSSESESEDKSEEKQEPVTTQTTNSTINTPKSILTHRNSLATHQTLSSPSYTREVNGYANHQRRPVEGSSTDYVYRTRNPEYLKRDSDQLPRYSSYRDEAGSRYNNSREDKSLKDNDDRRNSIDSYRRSSIAKDETTRSSYRDRKEDNCNIPSRYRRRSVVTDEDSDAYKRYLSRSRSSALLALSRETSPEPPRSRRSSAISRSKSSHALGDDSPPEDSLRSRLDRSPEDNGDVWAKYLRTKYGASRSSALRSSHSSSGSEDELPVTRGFQSPRSVYLQKKKPVLKFGARGSEPGCFTWPRGVAVGPDNIIVVADTQNHRVQVFDSSGRLRHVFGSYGSGQGEFDGLAGIAVNRIGQIIVSDRYNHRLQLFDPAGRFLRAFGSEGHTDGKLSLPWGVATDSLGFIYVCDKDNHRVQVFQSDGSFVGKFGGLGSRPGQLDHPHYVTVSSANRVLVTDSDNHRVQIFDVNGRSLATFGSEGSGDGQFKFPAGVAVDEQGFIAVGDSGNNRVQLFHPDGTFLRSFGTWGKAEGEFKGLEGIAMMTNGNILVCDRENHRVQVF